MVLHIPQPLLDEVAKRRVLPFIGAGFSMMFVIMGKIEEFIFFDILKPSIERYGLRSTTSNELLVTQGPLMDNIRTTILQCRLVIAEITDGNPSVMYELGLAIGNKKPIIMLSQTDIPSNLTSFHHILYKNTVEDYRKG